MRFMREAWVLLSCAAGDAMCCEDGVDCAGAALGFNGGGVAELMVGPALATGDRERWVVWRLKGDTGGAAPPICGGGGGDVTNGAFFS